MIMFKNIESIKKVKKTLKIKKNNNGVLVILFKQKCSDILKLHPIKRDTFPR